MNLNERQLYRVVEGCYVCHLSQLVVYGPTSFIEILFSGCQRYSGVLQANRPL